MPQEILRQGLARLQLDLDRTQVEQLLAYVALLHKWNRAYNLTAIREPRDMVVRHLLDSLAVLPHLGPEPVLDVGTGGGIPGLVLAICRPGQPFTLLDSNGKKTRFVRQAALELGLPQVAVVQSRVEQYRSHAPQVISRAFASLQDMVDLAGHLMSPGGRLLAMKGALVEQERSALAADWHTRAIPLTVPFLNEARFLVVLDRPSPFPG